jgi:hypothetical protein
MKLLLGRGGEGIMGREYEMASMTRQRMEDKGRSREREVRRGQGRSSNVVGGIDIHSAREYQSIVA